MTLKNPFSDYGGIVIGERFVGRRYAIDQIQQRLLGENFGNLAIMGLPRIGKSSLGWNAIFPFKEDIVKRKIFPLWIALGEFFSLIELLDEILTSSFEELQKENNKSLDQLKEIIGRFNETDSPLEKKRFFKKYLKLIKSEGFRLIIVLDEFDNSQSIFNLQDFQFLREISYNPEIKIGILSISRKTVQELEPDNGCLSNFHLIFTDLRLKLFNGNDIELYWNRLKKLGINISETYTNNIIYYSGNHPYLLDIINHEIFNNIEQYDLNLDKIFDSTIENLRLKIFNEYESILKLMDSENMTAKLIQLVVGPLYDITQRDVEKLLKYNLVIKNVDNSYSCFSEYFYEYLSIKSNEVDIWPLWSETESKIRSIIKVFLKEKYGEDWVDKFVSGNPKKVSTIENLKKTLEKSTKAFGDKSSNHLVDYTYPRDMIDCFMHSDWTWFKKIFKRQINDWIPIFEHLSKIRTPLAHNNRDFLTQADINIATGYCQEILTLISENTN